MRILPEMVDTATRTDGPGRCGQQHLVGWTEPQSEGRSILGELYSALFVCWLPWGALLSSVMMHCLVGGPETNDQMTMEWKVWNKFIRLSIILGIYHTDKNLTSLALRTRKLFFPKKSSLTFLGGMSDAFYGTPRTGQTWQRSRSLALHHRSGEIWP